jgi:DNA-binding IscR family transcriptional regulator
LRHVLDEAVKAFYAALDQYTLEDLLRNRHAVAKVLFIDTPRARAAA